jgi:hypothetical protein
MKHEGTDFTPTLNNEWMYHMIWAEDLVSDEEPDAKTVWRYVLRNECYVKSERQHIERHLLKDGDFRNITKRLYLQKENNNKLYRRFVSNYELKDLFTRANLHNFIAEL